MWSPQKLADVNAKALLDATGIALKEMEVKRLKETLLKVKVGAVVEWFG